MEVVYATLENKDGTAILKQHAFKPTQSCKPYTGEEFIGNISLCGKISAGSLSWGEVELFENLQVEEPKKGLCKLCKRVLKANAPT